jgi:hypothetical protein
VGKFVSLRGESVVISVHVRVIMIHDGSIPSSRQVYAFLVRSLIRSVALGGGRGGRWAGEQGFGLGWALACAQVEDQGFARLESR